MHQGCYETNEVRSQDLTVCMLVLIISKCIECGQIVNYYGFMVFGNRKGRWSNFNPNVLVPVILYIEQCINKIYCRTTLCHGK